MAILNSQLFWWYLVHTGTVLANGYFRYKPNYINPFPLPFIPEKTGLLLEKLADETLLIKQNSVNLDTSKSESEINEIIHDLYGLTSDEIDLIYSV